MSHIWLHGCAIYILQMELYVMWNLAFWVVDLMDTVDGDKFYRGTAVSDQVPQC